MGRRSKIKFLALAVILFGFAFPFSVGADTSQLDGQADEIFYEIMSPFCVGRSLKDCPSSKASELKEEIRSELQSGKSRPEILNELEQRFGPEILAMPRTSGVGAFAWLMPVVFFIVGAAIAVRFLLRKKRN